MKNRLTPSTHSTLILILLLIFSMAKAGMADSAGKCGKRCTPISPDPAFIEIDANTGQILGGATSFAESEKVQVIISRKNPFKYNYRAQIVSSPLDAGTAAAFLRLAPGFGSLIDSLLGTTQVTSQALTSAAPNLPGAPACPGPAKTRWEELLSQANSLASANEALTADAKKIEQVRKSYGNFIDATDKDSLGDTNQCSKICNQAAELAEEIDLLTELDEFKKRVENLTNSAKNVQDFITKFEKDISTAQINLCGIGNDLKKVKENTEKTSGNAEKLSKAIKELEAIKPSAQAMKEIISAALADENAFREVRYPYTGDGPTNVRITLFRRNLREEGSTEKEVTSIDLRVGQSRFSISAGVGFSTIEDRHIIRDGDKFGEENKSSLKPSLAIMLNAQLGRFWRWHDERVKTTSCPECPPVPMKALKASWGISTGLVLSNRNDTAEAEFILGPSIGLLDNNLFITLGYHAARVEKLGGGFEIGQEIPSDLTGELPIKRDWDHGVMLAVTYKMR